MNLYAECFKYKKLHLMAQTLLLHFNMLPGSTHQFIYWAMENQLLPVWCNHETSGITMLSRLLLQLVALQE